MNKRIQLEETGKNILNASRTELYIDMRFFGAALNSLGYEMDLSTTSIGTDAVNIRFNPSHVLRLFVEEPGKLNRTYVHILLHCIFMHMYTSANYKDERLFDICADIVVESILDSMDYQCIYRVSSDYRDRWYALLEKELKVLTVEKLYKYFSEDNKIDIFEIEKLEREFALDDHGFWLRLQNEETDPDKDKDKDKELPDELRNPEGGPDPQTSDNHKTKYINPRRLKQIKDAGKNWDKEGKRIQTEIETIGKQHSDKLGKLEWLLKVKNKSETDYRDFLGRLKILREEGGIDLDSFDFGMYSFGIEHYGNMPLIEENEFREVKKIQELVIVIDTSASTKDTLVQRFLEETAAILLDRENYFRKTNLYILQCDNQLQRVDVIKDVDEMNKYVSEVHLEGGYGTDFRPAFEKVEELIRTKKLENLKGLVYFTDGFGIYPTKATAYDTAFVFARDEEYDDENVPDWALKLYF